MADRVGSELQLRDPASRQRLELRRPLLRCGGAARCGFGFPTRRLRRTFGSSAWRRVRSRAVLVLTTSRRYAIKGVRPGTSTRALRRRLRSARRVRVGHNVWYVARGRSSELVFKAGRGRVLELGLADKRLGHTRARSERLLRSWQLGSR